MLTNPVLDPFGKIPEFKYCAVKVTAGGDDARANELRRRQPPRGCMIRRSNSAGMQTDAPAAVCIRIRILNDLMTDTSPSHDVRMQGFTRRHTVQAGACRGSTRSCSRSTPKTCRCAQPRAACSPRAIVSDIDVPGFDRATMDGYAVVADSTEGATPYNRVALKVVGDALPGSPFARHGRARRGRAHHDRRADAGRQRRACSRPSARRSAMPRGTTASPRSPTVSPGKNVGHRGEDIVAARRCSRPAACCGRRTSAS